MKQMQGLMAQFETAINQEITLYIKKPQGKLSRANKASKMPILKGTQHSTNPNTKAMGFCFFSLVVAQNWLIARLESSET